MRPIVSAFTVMVTAAAIVWLYWQFSDDAKSEGLRISANKTIFAPGDEMRISAGVNASRIKISVGDLYLAVEDPAGHVRFYRKVSEWTVKDTPFKEMASVQVEEIGPYNLFFVLCRLGLNPHDPQNWVVGISETVFVLPKTKIVFSKQQDEKMPRSHAFRPMLIAHGAGEIESLKCTNTREALEQSYAKGYRYFEIDFCWTADRHLVLIHDWKKSFQKLFINAESRPTLERFESMRMVHHLSQMTISSLYRWLLKHSDAHVITDVKEQNLEALSFIAKTAGDLTERFIPQIYDPGELKPVEKMGFKKVIFLILCIKKIQKIACPNS